MVESDENEYEVNFESSMCSRAVVVNVASVVSQAIARSGTVRKHSRFQA